MAKKDEIKKLNINLFPDHLEDDYNKARTKYIAEYTEYETGFLSLNKISRPDVGEANWNEMYPKGFKDWSNERRKLTSSGQQILIDKVNELTDTLNKMNKK